MPSPTRRGSCDAAPGIRLPADDWSAAWRGLVQPKAARPPHIPEDLWKILSASEGAVSHHWVPRMLLRNFTQHPDEDDPVIWCQPVDRGAPRRSRIGAECTIRNHNTVDGTELPAKSLEALYARIESDAAPVLRKLIAGSSYDEAERFAMALLIAAQYVRTPRSRTEHTYRPVGCGRVPSAAMDVIERPHPPEACRNLFLFLGLSALVMARQTAEHEGEPSRLEVCHGGDEGSDAAVSK
jgi:hypothetical protein